MQLQFSYKIDQAKSLKGYFKSQKIKRGLHLGTIILCLILTGYSLMGGFISSKAASQTLSRDDVKAGAYQYNDIDVSATGKVGLQDGSKGKWENQNNVPLGLPNGIYYPEMAYGLNNTLYVLPGNYTGIFKRYWIEEKRWEDLATMPYSNFSKLVFDGSRYFYTCADVGSYFFRYDSYTDKWEKLAEPSLDWMAGSNIEYVVKDSVPYIYAFRGGSTPYFWRYNINANTWEDAPSIVSPQITTLINTGSAMVWDRGNYLYIIRGNYTYTLLRYDLRDGTWNQRFSDWRWVYDVYKSNLVYLNSNELMIFSYNNMYRYTISTNSATWVGQDEVSNYSSRMVAFDGVRNLYLGGATDNMSNMKVYDTVSSMWDPEPKPGGSGSQSISQSISLLSSTPDYYTCFAFDGVEWLYVISGDQNSFYKKSVITGQVVTLPALSGVMHAQYACRMVVGSNNKIYVLRSYGYDNIYSFDIASSKWEWDPVDSMVPLLSNVPGSVYIGADMIDGGDGYLYVIRGYGSTGFYRMKMSDNTWDVNFGGTNNYSRNLPSTVYAGGGSAKVGNYIIVYAGDSGNPYSTTTTSRVFRYDLTTKVWSEDKIAPIAIGGVQYNSAVTSNGVDTFYFASAASSPDTDIEVARRFYSYNINSQTWKRLADLPNYSRGIWSRPGLFYYKNGITNAENVFAITGGLDNRLWRWAPSSDTYKKSATYFSKRFDLRQVTDLTTFNYTKTGSGTATVYTRTSDNLATWGNWNALSGNQIVSDPGSKRYFQFKVELSGDGTQNPQVSDFAFNYTQETNPPGQPDLVRAYSEKGGTALETGKGYVYHHPYFSWNPASDGFGGSGVAGYYVYFGDQSEADPAVVGSFQEGTEYVGDIPMQFEGGKVYYLRIKVKDILGNISTAVTHFSYIYQFVSPPEKSVVDTQADFAKGTSTALDISSSNGEATLQKISTGTWSDGDLSKIPSTFSGGGATYAKGSVYMVTGNGTANFYRFDLSASQWVALANIPENIPSTYGGSVLCFDGSDKIYLIVGDGSMHFYEYGLGTNIWTRKKDLPVVASSQTAMAKIGPNKYIISLMYSTVNFLYDSVRDSIEENTPAPGNFMTASSFYSKGDGVVYCLQEYNMLRKFVVADNRWYTIGRAPSFLLSGQNIGSDGIGDNIYFFGASNAKNEIGYKYSISQDLFSPISRLNMEMYDTSYVVSDSNRYIYLFHNARGSRMDNIFEKYDTVEDKFLPDLYTPQAAYTYSNRVYYNGSYGSELSTLFSSDNTGSYTYDGVDKYYAKFGGSKLAEYSISQKKLLREFAIPYPSYGHIEYLDGYIYMTASASNRFFRMNIETQDWEELPTIPGTSNINYADNLVKDKEGRLYTQNITVSNGSTKAPYMYNPNTNTWSKLNDSPISMGLGSQLVYDGNRYMYCFFGGNSNQFRVFDTSTQTWDATVLANVPEVVYYGSTAVYRQNKIYLFIGTNTKKSYVYDIATNSWTTGIDSVTEITYSGALLKIDDNYALLFPGGSKSAVWRYNFPSITNGNNAIGVYQAETFSIPGIFSYVNIEADVDLPQNTSIDFQTRSSELGGFDDTKWSAWTDVSSVKMNEAKTTLTAHINSPVARNLQVRAILKSYDSYNKPTLKKLVFNYFNDITPPNNPTLMKIYNDSSKSSEIDLMTWHNNSTPFMDWPEPGEMGGATDGLIGSNISKYYVYFGKDETAIPQTQGVLVTKTEYQPTLTDPGQYYMRIQAVDGANNIQPTVYMPFVYKFDNEKPTNPKLIEVNPSGYTRTNNFSFKWTAAIDNHSGVAQYCWKVGIDPAGAYFTERCQNGLDIANIPAGNEDTSQQGANTIYVRAKDVAGNYSSSYTQATFYYFNSGAPSAPSNLQASPVTNSVNSYSFTWDPPSDYVGNVDRLTYYYSINKLPDSTNTIATTSRSVGPIPAATQLGSNTFYVVAKDEAGNINWSMNSRVNFDAATFAPGIPLNFEVSDISSQVSKKWSLALSWDAPENDAGHTHHYYIYRSTDGVRFSKLDSTQNTYYVDSNLEESKTYQYQVSAADDINKEGPRNPSQTTGVSGVPTGSYIAPPEVMSLTAGQDFKMEDVPPVPDSVTPNSPVLMELGSKNAIIAWKTSRPSAGFVLFGKSGNITDSNGSLEKTDIHVVKLTGLAPDTTYTYKLQNFDQNRKYDMDKSISSNIYTFKTKSIPAIKDVRVENATIDQAQIKFKADGLSSFTVQYGEGNQYGMYKAGSMDSLNNGDYSIVLDKLQSSTGYNFKIVISTVDGDELSSDNYTFNTVDYPKISNVRVQPLEDGGSSYEVSWNTNVKTTSILSYQINADIVENKDEEMLKEHKMKVTGLLSGGEYILVPKGKDVFGNMVIGDSQKIKTGVDTKPPTISNLKIESSINANNKTAQLIMSWETDELSTSQIEFGKIEQGREKDYPTTSAQDNNLTKKHVVVVSNLELASTYHARALSYDASGNLARSEDSMAVVGRQEKTMIQRIIEVMANLFGWLTI